MFYDDHNENQSPGRFLLAKRDFELYNEEHPIYPCYRVQFTDKKIVITKNNKSLFDIDKTEIKSKQLLKIQTLSGISFILSELKTDITKEQFVKKLIKYA